MFLKANLHCVIAQLVLSGCRWINLTRDFSGMIQIMTDLSMMNGVNIFTEYAKSNMNRYYNLGKHMILYKYSVHYDDARIVAC